MDQGKENEKGKETNKMWSLPFIDLQLVSIFFCVCVPSVLNKYVSKTGNKWKSIFLEVF